MNYEDYNRITIDFYQSLAKDIVLTNKASFSIEWEEIYNKKLDSFFNILHNKMMPGITQKIEQRIPFVIDILYHPKSNFNDEFKFFSPIEYWKSKEGQKTFTKFINELTLFTTNKIFDQETLFHEPRLNQTLVSFFNITYYLKNNLFLPSNILEQHFSKHQVYEKTASNLAEIINAKFKKPKIQDIIPRLSKALQHVAKHQDALSKNDVLNAIKSFENILFVNLEKDIRHDIEETKPTIAQIKMKI